MYVHAPSAYSACTGQKQASDPLEMKLEILVGLRVAAGNGTQVVWKISAALNC